MPAQPRKTAAAKAAPAKPADPVAPVVDADLPAPAAPPVEPAPPHAPPVDTGDANVPDPKPGPDKADDTDAEPEAKSMTEAGTDYADSVREFIAAGRDGVIALREGAVDVGQITPVTGEFNVYPAVRRVHAATEHVTRGLDRLAGALADLERATTQQ